MYYKTNGTVTRRGEKAELEIFVSGFRGRGGSSRPNEKLRGTLFQNSVNKDELMPFVSNSEKGRQLSIRRILLIKTGSGEKS
jgi:hypothetical protein